MRFAFTDEQRQFQRSVREVLARECTPRQVREAWTSDTGRSTERWRALTDLGLLGVLISEEHGGLGMNELDLVLPLEECGRAALPEPVVETAAIVAPLLRSVGGPLAGEWLPRLASGDAMATIAFDDQPMVSDAHVARLLILERRGELHAVLSSSVRVLAERSVDGARRLSRVEWTPSAATRIASEEAARALRSDACDRAAVAVSAQLLGLSRAMIERTVEYAKVRTQFGQPIGSFQAVKHHLADAQLAVEMAAPVVYRAAHSLASAAAERSVHASMAKAQASEAALIASRAALQCHGAIGYSFEHDLHLWMKRAWALAAAWGDAAHHRARVGAALFATS